MISLVLKPLKKPYKYLHFPKTEFVEDMQVEEQNKASDEVALNLEEDMSKLKFGQFEKDLEREVLDIKYLRTIEDQKYQYTVAKDERLALIATLGSIFTEAIYGVQKRLYTGWKDFMTVLLENLKTMDSLNLLVFKAAWTNLVVRLRPEAVYELVSFLLEKNATNHVTNILLIKDLMTVNNSSKLTPICSLDVISYLYKTVKEQIKKPFLDAKNMYSLMETLYIAYFFHTDKFRQLFQMTAKDNKFVKIIRDLGYNYVVHFYAMGVLGHENMRFSEIGKLKYGYKDMIQNKPLDYEPQIYYFTNHKDKISLIYPSLYSFAYGPDKAIVEHIYQFISDFDEENGILADKLFELNLYTKILVLESQTDSTELESTIHPLEFISV